LNGFIDAPHNNGMHPTAKSVNVIRKTCNNHVECAAGDAGRWAASLLLEVTP
jgi:hypothetical protein